MPRPYSYDLRVRVVAAIEKGMEVKEASQMFGVHRGSLPVRAAPRNSCRPYSPDFNPIEHSWFPFKHRVRKLLPLYNRDLHKTFDVVLALPQTA